MDPSVLINWTSPLPILGVASVLFHFDSISNIYSCIKYDIGFVLCFTFLFILFFILVISQKLRARLGSRKTGLSPQYFNTDLSKAVLLLWFLIVTCSCCLYLHFGSAIMLVTYFSKF